MSELTHSDLRALSAACRRFSQAVNDYRQGIELAASGLARIHLTACLCPPLADVEAELVRLGIEPEDTLPLFTRLRHHRHAQIVAALSAMVKAVVDLRGGPANYGIGSRSIVGTNRDFLARLGKAEAAADALTHDDGDSVPSRPAARRMNKIAAAIAIKSEHPDWTNEKVAEEAGCHPKTLSKSKKYKMVCAAIKVVGAREHRPAGRNRGSDMEEYEEYEER